MKMKRFWIFIPLLLFWPLLLLWSCGPFLVVDTNIPLWTNKLSFINHLDVPVEVIVDGKRTCTLNPHSVVTHSYWVGSGPYNTTYVQVSVVVFDRINNRSWSNVIHLSGYYRLSFIFTIKEDYNKNILVVVERN